MGRRARAGTTTPQINQDPEIVFRQLRGSGIEGFEIEGGGNEIYLLIFAIQIGTSLGTSDIWLAAAVTMETMLRAMERLPWHVDAAGAQDHIVCVCACVCVCVCVCFCVL